MREARHVAAAVVAGSSRRHPNTQKQVIVCTLMQHVAFLNIKHIYIYIVLDAAARGGICACTSNVVYTPIHNSSRDDRPSISTKNQRTFNPLRVRQGQ